MTHGSDSRLVHHAFLYESRDAFVASIAPFIREGIDSGDTVFAATKPANIEALREELGSDGARVEFHDAAEWHTRPYERLQGFKRLVAAVPQGRGLRALGEPVWEGSPAVVRQLARYESIFNLALADADVRFVCLYDSAALPDAILRYALSTHPEQVVSGRSTPCPDFVAPESFVPGRPPAPPSTASRLPPELADLRRLVAEHALDAGIAHERAEDFVVAANEIATNAIRHGRPPIRGFVWVDADEVVCQITDAGSGIANPLTGWLPPSEGAIGGWGLPIARQFSDALEVTQSEAGNTVSLYLSRRPDG
jgi:anti-sigma regulatory factor (Ser/Thr protein kinase)